MLATKYSGRHKRVRYMLPRINWLMEQTKSLAVKMLRMGTDDLPADVGTKAGRGPQWRAKVDRVMGNYSRPFMISFRVFSCNKSILIPLLGLQKDQCLLGQYQSYFATSTIKQ